MVEQWATQGGGYGPEKYIQHLTEVKEWIPSDHLLEFNVKQGWVPLCKFLKVEVPDQPFPHLNETKDINTGFLMAQMMGAGAWVLGLTVVIGGGWLAMAPPAFVKAFFKTIW